MQSFTFQEIEAIETPDKLHGARPPQDAQRVLPAEPGRAGRGHVPARGAGGGRRSQEAADRDRAVHPEGAHPQGAGGAAAQSRLLGQGPAVRRRVRHPLHARTPPPGWPPSAPARPTSSGWRARRRSRRSARPTPTRSCRRSTTRWRRSAWRWPRTGRPSTTCGSGGPCRMAIDRQKQVDTVFEGHGIIGWGVPYIYYQDTPPTAKDFGPWWQYKPAEAKKLLTEAGHGKGFETTLFYYEYFPQMTSAGPARPAGPQAESQHRRQDHQARLHDLLRTLRREQVGRDVVGLPVGPRHRGRRADLPVHALEVARRTSSASTTRSSTSSPPSCAGHPTAPSSARSPRRSSIASSTRCCGCGCRTTTGSCVFQPHMRNAAAPALRRTDGYGSPTIARIWLDK